jgi:hypothetical protein
MKLIFEVDIDPNDNLYFSQDSVDSEFKGDWVAAMNWLIEHEGISGIGLDDDMKLVRCIE